MNIINRISRYFLLVVLPALMISSCKEDTPVPDFEPEEVLGSFEYDGDTYGIRSVVVYELGNDTQIWISETAGYTTVEQIEKSVGELVINIPNSRLGGQKETFEQNGNFIRYDEKENSGLCMVSCSIDRSSGKIELQFSSQRMKAGVSNAISGHYSGPFSEYKEAILTNQWAYNRKSGEISSARYIDMEDGAPSRFILYGDKDEAVDFTIAPANIGKTVTISTNNVPAGTSVLYDNGEEFKLTGAYGSIKVNCENEKLDISIRLTNEGGKMLRAEYSGPYVKKLGNKSNRCRFDSGTEGYGYNGTFALDGLSVQEGSEVTFRFTPGNATGSTMVDGNMIPVLKVSRDLINEGETDLAKTEKPWSFTYHTFQVYSYDASQPDRPKAADGSIMSVTRKDNGSYEINLEVRYMVDQIITRDKVDENGNIVYTEIQKTDQFGTPLLDENGDPVMEKVPVKEQVTVKVPSSIDLYYNE